METIKESITYYSGLQQLSFGVLLIVAVIVVCFSLINLVNTTITNFLSRRQEIGMLQAIGLSKKQLIKMLCYEGLMYSVFATLVTLVLGTGLGFLSVQVVVKTMNPYFYYSFPWLIVLIYLAILLIVQFTLISYTTGNLKNNLLLSKSGRWNSRMGSAGRRVLPRFFRHFSKKFLKCPSVVTIQPVFLSKSKAPRTFV